MPRCVPDPSILPVGRILLLGSPLSTDACYARLQGDRTLPVLSTFTGHHYLIMQEEITLTSTFENDDPTTQLLIDLAEEHELTCSQTVRLAVFCCKILTDSSNYSGVLKIVKDYITTSFPDTTTQKTT